MNDSNILNKILWLRALWNSFLVLLIGLVIYMLPGLVVGIKMGFELASKMKDNNQIGSQISEAVSRMYQKNIIFIVVSIIVTCLAILWRSRIVSIGTGDKKLINGSLVSSLPSLIGLLFIFMKGFNIIPVLGIALFIGVGLFGSLLHEKPKTT